MVIDKLSIYLVKSVDEITIGMMSEDEMSVDDMSADKMTELVNCGQDAFICHVCK